MSTVIDIAIGLALVFMLVSLLASGVQEALANAFNSRGKLLEQAVIQLLDGYLAKTGGFLKDTFRVRSFLLKDRCQPSSLATQLLGHGLLASLFQGDRLPSYIPAEKFADALIDCLRRRAGESRPTPEGLLWAVHRLPPSQAMYALETIIIASSKDLTMIRKQFMEWYDASMDRVSGWYTRAVRYRTFIIGLVVAIAFQIDAIGITQTLAQDPALRSHLVEVAIAQSSQTVGSGGAPPTGTNSNPTAPNRSPPVSETLDRLSELGLPIGWSWCAISSDEKNGKCVPGLDIYKLIMLIGGWLIVALAASQGAPFWFNLIGQLINLRGTGRKPASADTPTGSPQDAASVSPWTPAAAAPAAAIAAAITADDLRNVQTKLGVPSTGSMDVATSDALRSTQIRLGIPADGILTVPLARQILK